jgi:prolyl oligopeptidase
VVGDVALPELCSVVGLDGGTDRSLAFVQLEGFTRPASLFRWTGGELEAHGEHDHDDVLEAQFAVSQERYSSADGTEIGLFLVHRADEPPDVDTPCILTGYGGFAIAETPAWSPTIAAWAEAGGLFAVAGLRGGYEEGESWHQAGRRQHKQRVFDDFHAAADHLVTSQRTSRDRLAIRGGSNGGLLVGVAMTQRPDLCRAVHCAVPLLDMVRYPQFLIARLWTDEYGDPDVAEELEWLLAYSPYHHVDDGVCYPAVLMTTAESDSRVDPLHARKMAAALQAASSCPHDHPILLQQESRAGHGQGKPLHKQADELADVLSFFTWQLGVEAGT